MILFRNHNIVYDISALQHNTRGVKLKEKPFNVLNNNFLSYFCGDILSERASLMIAGYLDVIGRAFYSPIDMLA